MRQHSDVDVDDFVKRLAYRVVTNFSEADSNGFTDDLRNDITSMLEFKNEEVRILDRTLTI